MLLKRIAAAACFLLAGIVLAQAADSQPLRGGALGGQRPRVIVSSDIGGGDPDDFQSMVHYLIHADIFDTEGLISSPPGLGRKSDILDVIAAYEKDFPKLCTHQSNFPAPDALRDLAKQGAVDPAPEAGFSEPTEGSRWIIRQAWRNDRRPLWILVWGSATDVAQAVHDAPGIMQKIRVYNIGSSNTRHDPHAHRYLLEQADLWWIDADTTFRGMYIGGAQKGDLGNCEFVERHVKGHGALGDFYYSKKIDLKMGDTPSVLYLMRGNPNDPESEHWGGRFVRDPRRPTRWIDDPDPRWREGDRAGAKTVSRWREAYLRDWQSRMDWALHQRIAHDHFLANLAAFREETR